MGEGGFCQVIQVQMLLKVCSGQIYIAICGNACLETLGMTIPHLPFARDGFNRHGTRIYLGRPYINAAKAARPKGDGDRLFIT